MGWLAFRVAVVVVLICGIGLLVLAVHGVKAGNDGPIQAATALVLGGGLLILGIAGTVLWLIVSEALRI